MTKKTYSEPTTLEEAKITLADIKLELVALETKLTKTEEERAKKDQEWKNLNARYNDDIKKAKAGKPAHASSLPTSASEKELATLRQRINDLQTENNQYSQEATVAQNMIDKLGQQKETLENKIKLLENKEEQPLTSTWEKVKKPTIVISLIAVVLFIVKLIKNKISGE